MRIKKASKYIPILDVISVEDRFYYSTHPNDFIYDVVFHNDSKYHKKNGYFLSKQQEIVLDSLVCEGSKNVSVVSGKGLGKATSTDSLIPTCGKGMVRAGDIGPGDKIIGKDGKPTTVLMIHPQGKLDLFKITLSSGATAVVSDDHLWEIFKHPGDPSSVMNTKELREYIDTVSIGRPYIDFCEPVDYSRDTELDDDPYTLGQLITGKSLFFIPENYLFSSIGDRKALLRGLCKLDKYYNVTRLKQTYSIYSDMMADQIIQLVRSLGGAAKKVTHDHFTIDIDIDFTGKNYVESIEFHSNDEAVCFTVDSQDSLYLMNDYTVTHNTALAAFAGIWFITCFDLPKIAVTAPSFPQLNSAFWPEVNLWLMRSLLRKTFVFTSERMYYPHAKFSKNWWMEPRTASKPESMQGLHQQDQLIIVDEGSGVGNDIYRVIDDTQTGDHNITLAISNGTKINGWFYDSQHTDKINWDAFNFSALDSPFVNKAKAQRLIDRFGIDHDIVRVGILGKFPKGNSDAFISLGEYRDAVNRYYEPKSTDKITIGMDVARQGDDLSSITWKWGNKVYKPIIRGKSPLNETLAWLVYNIKEIRNRTGVSTSIRVKIDDTGLGGSITDHLRPLAAQLNVEVVPCVFSSGDGDDMYADRIAKMWGAAKNMLAYLDMPDDEFLQEEATTRRVNYDTGKIRMESKTAYKVEYSSSPDRADSWVLCCYEPKNERKLIPSFEPTKSGNILEDIGYINDGTMITSIWYSDDLFTSIVKIVWDGFKLFVVDEYCVEDSIASVMGFIRRSPSDTILGNQTMFGVAGQDIRYQFMQHGCIVQQNPLFDQHGSIQMLNMMIRDKRFGVHSRCHNMISQLDRWNLEKSRKISEVEYGLCYGLINTISSLRHQISPPVSHDITLRGYHLDNVTREEVNEFEMM